MKFAMLVWRNLRRSPRRTVLTTLAIALAAFTYSSLSSLPNVTRRMLSTPDSARRIAVMSASGFFNPLPDSYKRKILAAPHVVAASGLVYFGGVYRSPSDQLGIAVDADQAELMWPDWGVTPKRASEFRASTMACLVPAAMLRKYGWHVGEQIILKGTIVPVDVTLRIADTLGASAPPDALLFRRDYLERSLAGRPSVNAYHVMLDRADSVPSAIAAIDEIFSNSAAETHSQSEASWFANFVNFDTLFAMLRAMAILVVAAVALVALNTVVIAVRERHTEIAVMRAIGFSPALVLCLTVAESAFLGVVGGALGCAATFLVAKVLPFAFLPLGPVDLLAIVSPLVVAQAFVMSIAIGAVAGLVPAIGSVRRSVVESIRAIA
ncbi:MAG TPA: ABC transporter permease [Candidatus Binataceae bacterium]